MEIFSQSQIIIANSGSFGINTNILVREGSTLATISTGKNIFSRTSVKETFDKISKFGKVIVFGTGNCGAIVQAALKEKNIKIHCLVDNNKHKWGKIIQGDQIINPKKLKSIFSYAKHFKNVNYIFRRVFK